ncbi:MAG: hypothetical protein M3220_11515 [Chloroflexota bacterium]|nr:hypothetical protein [Chloroflexota bacterium]
MSHDRNMPKKPKRKPKKRDKKRKGLPPHLERAREENSTLREIQRHIDDLSEQRR